MCVCTYTCTYFYTLAHTSIHTHSHPHTHTYTHRNLHRYTQTCISYTPIDMELSVNTKTLKRGVSADMVEHSKKADTTYNLHIKERTHLTTLHQTHHPLFQSLLVPPTFLLTSYTHITLRQRRIQGLYIYK